MNKLRIRSEESQGRSKYGMKSLLRATDVWKGMQLCGAPGDGVSLSCITVDFCMEDC